MGLIIEAQTVNNTLKLLQLSKEFEARNAVRKAEMQKLAKQYGLPITMNGIDGQASELQYFENGHPRYHTTTNLDAAKTISTYRVWPSGGAGLNLNGLGQILGEWDAGGVRLTHQELSGRVTQMDSPSSLHDHSTHVAGTMIASGVVSTAIGMSFAGTLHAWDWNSDDAEMAAAAATGLKVSNHSYGYIAGWYSNGANWYWYGDVDVSLTEDAGFGFYDATANDWDNIAYNAPGYLIAKSADNNRGEGPSPGTGHYYWNGAAWTWSTVTRDKDGGTLGYDCIPYYATAKNILTVGAVNDIVAGYSIPADVVMSTFSGWGPTDDGRIKPDIVANGIGVYSSLSSGDATYANYNGTSMATPSVAGSVGLILQHKENLDGGSEAMLSATIKGLIIHTADEAGTNNGPDYVFGWGLMNTETATEVMTADLANGSGFNIRELNLANGGTFQTTVYADGSSPLRTTLVWTDPAGTSPAWSLDPTTAMLVNDLDMRLTDATPTTYYPYILNPASPVSAATTGDNFRDNVEQIYKTGTTYGQAFTLTITHKGSLSGGLQNFSLILTGVTPNPTYTWIGASGSSWATSSNWSPARTNPGVADILQFNDGGTFTINSVPTQTVGRITVTNNTKITLQSVATTTLTIGDIFGTDLSVDSGAELNISGSNALNIYLPTSATASISGAITFTGGAQSFTSATASGILFNSGSSFTTSTGFTGNPFGISTPYNAVVFSSGSTFIHGAGSDPFGAVQPNSVTTFQSGSLYKLTSNLTPSIDGRTYANIEIDVPSATITATGSNAVSINNLTINNGTFNLNMTGTPGHAIKGNISVASGATLNFSPSSTGTIILNGLSTQTISGSGTISGNTNSTLIIDNQVIENCTITLDGNLTINAAKSITINATKNLCVVGTLANSAGNTGFVLKSDVTGTASLLHNSNNVNATIERYLTGNTVTNNTYDFHLVSIPLNSDGISSMFNGMYLYEFSPTTNDWLSLGNATNTVLDNNQGFMIFYPNTNTTISFTGQLNNGSFTALTPSNASDQFNLVPNPYPSAINWNAVSGWTKTGIRDAFYIWNPGFNNYSTWGSYCGTLNATSNIPVGQSFIIKTDAPTTVLGMTNDVRVHGTQAFYKETHENTLDLLRLRVSDTTSADELIVRFSAQATNETHQLDVDKLFGNLEAPQIYTVSNRLKKLTINTLPYSTQTVTVPVGLEYNRNEQLTFDASGIESFNPSTSVYLEDKLLNRLINLKENISYSFNHNTETTSPRFNLIFYGVIGIDGNNTPNDYLIWSTEDQVNIHIPAITGKNAVIELYNLVGQLIYKQHIALGSPSKITVPQFNGMGIVKVISGSNIYVEKVFIR